MVKVSRIAGSTLLILLSEGIGKLFNLLAFFLMARYLGVEDIGKFSLVGAYLYFFGMLANSGLDMIVVRELSKPDRDQVRVLGNGVFLKTVFATVSLSLAVTISFFIDYDPMIRLFIVLMGIGLLFSSFTLFSGIFMVKMRMVAPSIIHISARLLYLGLTVALILLGLPLWSFIALNGLIIIPEFIGLLSCSRALVPFKLSFDPQLWRYFILESIPIGISLLFISVYTRIDQLMIKEFLSFNEVGLYNAAARVVEVPRMMPTALLAILFPVFTRLQKDSLSFRRAYRESFRFMNLCILPICFFVTYFSSEIIRIAYGSEFLGAKGSMTILIWAEVFVFLGMVNNRLLISISRQKLDLFFTGVSAAVNVLLNLVLIPRYQLAGAAIATLVSYACGPIMGLFIPLTRDFSRTMFATSWRVLFVGLIIFVPLRYLQLPASLSFIIALFAYPAGLYLVGEITPSRIKDLLDTSRT